MTRGWGALVGAFAALGVGGGARAQTIVYDPATYAKVVQQVETELQSLAQLEQSSANGQGLLRSLNTNSGVNGLAVILASPTVRSFLPETTAFVTAGQGGGLASLGSLAAAATAIRNQNRLYTPNPGDTFADAIDAQGDRAARDLAAGQAVGTAAQARLTGLQELQTSLSTAGDARAVLDLQARIQVEQAMIANDQMRLQGLAMAQAAEARLQAQRDEERAEAARAARLSLYKAAIQ